jgi:hypothetical protein
MNLRDTRCHTTIFIYSIVFFSIFNFSLNLQIHKITFRENSIQIYTSEEVNPIKILLNLIASDKEPTFCIKRLVGVPQPYKSYKCPMGMNIYEDNPNVCIKECEPGLVRGKLYCEKPCEKGYTKQYDLCVNKSNNHSYQQEIFPLVVSNPICINGYYSDGFCHSCFGNSEHFNGLCLSPCNRGSPSDHFCAFNDDSNKNLSLVNDYWGRFIRSIFDDLFIILKNGTFENYNFSNAKDLKDISQIFEINKPDKFLQIISGRILVYLRDKFKININEGAIPFLRNIYLKLLTRYEDSDKSPNTILAVVDDIIYFNGDYQNEYLNAKNYGLESLPLTVANFLEHMC